MIDNIYAKGSTSVITQVMLRDSTTGQGKTGLTYSTVTAYYVRPGGTSTAITLIAGSPGDVYSSGKFAEVDATHQPGVYQVHLPVGCFATGANAVDISYSASGMLDKRQKISLIDADLRNVANLGLTALPAVAPSSKGGLLVTDAATGLKIVGYNAGNVETFATAKFTFDASYCVNADVIYVQGIGQTGRDIGNALPEVGAGAIGGLPILDANLKAPETPLTTKLPNATAGAASGLVINDGTTAYTQKQVYDKAAAANTVAPDNASIGAIKTQTDKLTFDLITSVNYLKVTVYGFVGSLLTGPAAYLRAAFDYFFNVATPAKTINDIPAAAPSASTIAGAVLDEAKGAHAGLLAGVALDSTVAKEATLSALAGISIPAIMTVSTAQDVVTMKTAGGATLATFTKTMPGGVETWTKS